MLKARLVELEKRTEDVLRHLGEEVKSIEYVKSLFGRHYYATEWAMLKLTLLDISRGTAMLNPELIGGSLGELYSEREKRKFATAWLTRGRRTLEKISGE
jgi:hypothetical protein